MYFLAFFLRKLIYSIKKDTQKVCLLKIKFYYFFNIVSHISLVDNLFASPFIFFFISSNLSSEVITDFRTSFILSSFFIHTPTFLFSKNSAFCSSCPGIGFIIIIGNSEAKLSVVVRPPWLCYY